MFVSQYVRAFDDSTEISTSWPTFGSFSRQSFLKNENTPYTQTNIHQHINDAIRQPAKSRVKLFGAQIYIYIYVHYTVIETFVKQTRTRNEKNNEMKIKVGNCAQKYRKHKVERAQHKSPTKGRNMATRTRSYEAHTIFGTFKWPSHGSESIYNEFSRPRNVTHSTVRQLSTPQPTPTRTWGSLYMPLCQRHTHTLVLAWMSATYQSHMMPRAVKHIKLKTKRNLKLAAHLFHQQR